METHNPQEVLDTVNEDVTTLGQILQISSQSVLLFVLFFDNSLHRGGMSLSDLGSRLGGVYNVSKWIPFLQELLESGLLIKTNGGYRNENHYLIPSQVMDLLIQGKPIKREITKNLTNQEFFTYLRRYLNQFESKRNVTVKDTMGKLVNLIENNSHLPISKFIQENELNRGETLFLLYTCFKHMEDGEPVSFQSLIRKVDRELDDNSIFVIETDDDIDLSSLYYSFRNNNHLLLTKNIITTFKKGEFKNVDIYCLTPEGIKLFFKDVHVMVDSNKQDHDSPYYSIISPDSIGEEKLYYSERNRVELGKIERLLMGNNLQKSFERGKEYGLKEGIKIILRSEGFGTGKSSWVRQLGRKTGRNVLQVNLSSLKSSYFSESQKNVQELFDEYDKLMGHIIEKGGDRDGNRIPILFIDEVSSLFISRQNLNDSTNSSVNNTLHEISNIVLSRLDNFRGILICTSNSFSNSGYELEEGLSRRFTVKLNIDSPDEEVRFQIIRDNLSMWLTEEECRKLSTDYSITGGQIKVVKHRVVSDTILNNPVTLDIIREYFEIESQGWKTNSCSLIGFCPN